ncbi:MAG TPA: hypothetical protein VF149_04650, partial [Bacillales bacterium]
MSKSLLTKIAAVVVILAAFIGYNIYSNWDQTHFSANPETFNIKDSYQAVLKAQNQRFRNLNLAREFGLPKQVNQSVILHGKHRKITVHEIWFRSPSVFLLYSINLHKGDKDESDVPELQFSSMQIETTAGKSINAAINTDVKRGHPEQGVVYNGKLYRGVFLFPDFDETNSRILGSILNLRKNINKITLKNPALISGEDNKTRIGGLSPAYNYNYKDYKVIELPLNEKITFDTGTTIKFSRFQAWIQFNKLDFTIESGKSNIRSFYIQSHQPGYNLDMFGGFGAYVRKKEDGSQYSVQFPSFSEVPDNLTLKITDVGLEGKKAVFKIPVNLDAKEKKIGQVLGTPFYFEGYKNGQFNQEENTVTLQLKWRKPSHAGHPEGDRLVRFFPRPYWRYKLRLEHARTEAEKQQIKQNAENLVKIENEKGERPKFIRRYATNTRYDTHTGDDY